MDIIELARQIGREIQQDEAYIQMRLAEQTSENDLDLQNLINKFNMTRITIDDEAMNPERDSARLKELNTELRKTYAEIMQNEHMAAYNKAKQEFNNKLQRVLAIIQNSADGENPDTTDFVPGGCSGSCSSCSGCH